MTDGALPTWNDVNGDAHQVRITRGLARRLRENGVFDIVAAVKGRDEAELKLFRCLDDDDCIVRALAVIEDRPETEIEDLLDGDATEQAEGALLQAVINFFPEVKRKLLQAVAQKTEQYLAVTQPEMTAGVLEEIRNLDLDSLLKPSMTPGSGSSESSESSVVTAKT